MNNTVTARNEQNPKLIPFAKEGETKPSLTKEELFKICEPIATQQNILNLFIEDLTKSGVVGEEKICKLLYLALTTRHFDRPISVAVKGPSAGGKSFLVDKVLGFFPSSAYYMLSSMSSKALIYTKVNFKHRFILFAEADGITEQAEYYIRTLLSENCLRHEVTESDKNGEFHTRLVEKEGPTGLILTTTRTTLNPENETRIISVNVVDTKEQAKAVLLSIADEDEREIEMKGWLAFQEWLSTDLPKVVIPYSRKLAELTSVDALRMKRDFKAVLNLIKAHALLHQCNRERTAEGAIIATLDDYAAVREIVGVFIAEGIESSVPPIIRETVKAVETLIREGLETHSEKAEGIYYVSLPEIALKLGLDKSPTARRVKAACEAEYLVNLDTRSGHPAKIVMGNPLPEEKEVLPSVEQLKA